MLHVLYIEQKSGVFNNSHNIDSTDSIVTKMLWVEKGSKSYLYQSSLYITRKLPYDQMSLDIWEQSKTASLR